MDEISADLNGRIALVTGAGKNIGRMVAIKLARAGAKVGVTYQSNKAGAQEVCETIAAEGNTCIPLEVELTDPASILRCIDEFEKSAGGPVEIFVNNAAIRPPNRLPDISVELWDLVMNTNARPAFIFSQRLMPKMMERGWGRIIYISGVHAHMGAKNPAVSASKLAGVGLMRALSAYGASSGVTANVVVPGFVNTHHDDEKLYGTDTQRRSGFSKIPVGRLSEPEDIANMCLFLASDGASYVTGQEMFVSGGLPPHGD